MFAGRPRHLRAEDPARGEDFSLVLPGEPYDDQPSAGLPGGAATGHAGTIWGRLSSRPRGARSLEAAANELRQAIALFRYGVIADLVHLPVGTPGTGAMMRAKAKQTYSIPGSNRTRVAAETMRGWIADYRRGSFDALYPKPRTDRGKPRRLPAEVVERLIALKTGNPGWSVRIVIEAPHREGIDHPIAPFMVLPAIMVQVAFTVEM